MRLYDSDGAVVSDPLEVVCQRMELALARAMFGQDTEAQIYALRRSVLGDEAGPPPNPIIGLEAALK